MIQNRLLSIIFRRRQAKPQQPQSKPHHKTQIKQRWRGYRAQLQPYLSNRFNTPITLCLMDHSQQSPPIFNQPAEFHLPASPSDPDSIDCTVIQQNIVLTLRPDQSDTWLPILCKSLRWHPLLHFQGIILHLNDNTPHNHPIQHALSLVQKHARCMPPLHLIITPEISFAHLYPKQHIQPKLWLSTKPWTQQITTFCHNMATRFQQNLLQHFTPHHDTAYHLNLIKALSHLGPWSEQFTQKLATLSTQLPNSTLNIHSFQFYTPKQTTLPNDPTHKRPQSTYRSNTLNWVFALLITGATIYCLQDWLIQSDAYRHTPEYQETNLPQTATYQLQTVTNTLQTQIETMQQTQHQWQISLWHYHQHIRALTRQYHQYLHTLFAHILTTALGDARAAFNTTERQNAWLHQQLITIFHQPKHQLTRPEKALQKDTGQWISHTLISHTPKNQHPFIEQHQDAFAHMAWYLGHPENPDPLVNIDIPWLAKNIILRYMHGFQYPTDTPPVVIWPASEGLLIHPKATIPHLFTQKGYHEYQQDQQNLTALLITLAQHAGQHLTIAEATETINQAYFNAYAENWLDQLHQTHIQTPPSPIAQVQQLDAILQKIPIWLPTLKTIVTNTTFPLKNAQHTHLHQFQPLQKYLLAEAKRRGFHLFGDTPTTPLIETLKNLRTNLSHILQAAQPGETALAYLRNPPEADPIAGLHAQASQLPFPLNLWLQEIANHSQQLLQHLAEKAILTAYQQQLAPQFSQTLAHRYPFDPTQKTDGTISAVQAFFEPKQGALQHFLSNMKLTPKTNAIRLPDIIQQHLAWQHIFYPQGHFGATTPMAPVKLGLELSSADIMVDDQHIHYAHGPAIQSTLPWPMTGLNAHIQIKLQTHQGQTVTREYTGPWAMLRMLQDPHNQTRQTADGKTLSEIMIEGHHLTLQLGLGDWLNWQMPHTVDINSPTG